VYDDCDYLSLAVDLSIEAYNGGFSPVGALLVDNDTGEIIGRAKSQRKPGNVNHAEYEVLSRHVLGKDSEQLTLYTTLEPCIMCMAFATVLRIKRVVWLVDDEWGGASKVYDYKSSLYVKSRLPEIDKALCKRLAQKVIDLWVVYLRQTGQEEYIKMMLGLQARDSNMIPIYVITNDKHLWLLQGFAYLFNTYWSNKQPVTIVGFNPPEFELPKNFKFHSLGTQNKPAKEWSNKLLSLIDMIDDTHFILFLEDFWLIDKADVDCIKVLIEWMKQHPDALRMDLWRERAAKKQAKDFERVYDYQIIETPPKTKYQMSLQANIWNKDLLREIIIPNESPWQVEIVGSQRFSKRSDLRVFGTRNSPLKYEPVYQKGKFNIGAIPNEHKVHMIKNGFLNDVSDVV
jgi:tRNA(Arg) A34 adenosine deaminase TadA